MLDMTSRLEADTPATAWPESLRPSRLNEVAHATPFLITDCRVIEDRYRRLVELVPGLAVFYAVKCNSSAVVLSTLAAAGAGFEVASSYELDSVTAVGVSPEDVLYSNTVKPAHHVAAAFEQGVDRFAFDSEAELRKIAAYAPGPACTPGSRSTTTRASFRCPPSSGPPSRTAAASCSGPGTSASCRTG